MTSAVDDQEAGRLNDRLVDELVRNGAVEDPRIERAFRAVRRDLFLSDSPPGEVFADRAVVTRRGPDGIPVSSSSQPSLMACMLGQLRLQPGLAVLEIGTGTGYNAALLGHAVGPEGSVVTVDLDRAITSRAEHRLAARQALPTSWSSPAMDGPGSVGPPCSTASKRRSEFGPLNGMGGAAPGAGACWSHPSGCERACKRRSPSRRPTAGWRASAPSRAD